MGRHLLLVDRHVEAEKAANWAGPGRFDFVADDPFVEMLMRGPTGRRPMSSTACQSESY